MSQELYNLLKEGESREIPWHIAAEHLLKLKIASGGLLPEDIEELHEEAKYAGVSSDPITREDLAKAVKGGYLSGVRSTVSGDMSRRNAVRRKRGERAGKTLGSIAGAAGGALISSKNRLAGAALGTLLGYTGGKAIGEETDARLIKARMRARPVPKAAAIEKTSDFGKEAEEKKRFDPIPLIAGGAVIGGLGAGGLSALKATRKFTKSLGRRFSNKPAIEIFGRALQEPGMPHTVISGAAGGALAGSGAHLVRKKLHERKLEKKAQEVGMAVPDEAIPIEAPVVPQLDPVQQAAQEAAVTGQQSPVDALLQAQQAANEAEFFRQKAEEAEEAIQQESERASMMEAQLQQTNQMAEQQAQESAAREQQIGQQAQMATQQAQMASQDSVQARNESLSAQHQNIALRQAVTNFRQSLMDLVAQDPTQMLGPPAVPQGPMEPGGAPPMDQGQPPQEAGPPPGQPPMGSPPGQPPMGPPPGQPPMGPPMPPPAPMGAPGMQPPGTPQGGPPMGPPAGPPAGPAV